MGSNKKMWQETSRWVRVGALAVSAISPFINILLARLRANVEAEEALAQLVKDELAGSVEGAPEEINLDVQERLQAVGATINDLLLEVRESPYSQQLLQRSEELRERGSQLSQAIAERGSRLTQDLAERGGEISHDLAQRSLQARRGLAARDRNFWILLGFGTGLVAAAIATFFFVRRRLQESAVEESLIQLPYENPSERSTNSPRGNIYSVGANGTKLEAQSSVADTATEASAPNVPATDTSAIDAPASIATETTAINPTEHEGSSAAHPADAAFVGVSSTKQYYPAETPLDQLYTAHGEASDVVYFSSEDEAQRQGFSAALR